MKLFENKKAQLGWIKVIFMALIFLLVFGLLSGVTKDSTELYQSQWGDDYKLESWIIGGLNIWIFLGFILFVIISLVYGVSVT